MRYRICRMQYRICRMRCMQYRICRMCCMGYCICRMCRMRYFIACDIEFVAFVAFVTFVAFVACDIDAISHLLRACDGNLKKIRLSDCLKTVWEFFWRDWKILWHVYSRHCERIFSSSLFFLFAQKRNEKQDSFTTARRVSSCDLLQSILCQRSPPCGNFFPVTKTEKCTRCVQGIARYQM
jgi:hypothetical protein